MAELWGIDLGGSKIEGVVLPDENSIEPLCRIRIPTESERGYAHVLGQIDRLVGELKAASGRLPTAIGFGTPGIADPVSGLMKNCNSQCLNGMPLAADLSDRLKVQVSLANDANCFALAEARHGAGKGAAVVFGVIMGTGVGGGVVVHGRVLNGHQGIAGEWGHNVLDPEGKICYCGKRGCVETVLSGPAVEAGHRDRCGAKMTLPEIVASARRGEPNSQTTLDRLIASFGKALAVVVNVLDPDVVVLGGGVGNIDELYTRGREALEPWVFNDSLQTPIVRPLLGDSAGVFGAAHLTSRTDCRALL